MRWVSLAEKMPENIEDVHLRYADDHAKLFYDTYKWYDKQGKIAHGSEPFLEDRTAIHFGQWGAGGRYELDEVEWLDESSPDN